MNTPSTQLSLDLFELSTPQALLSVNSPGSEFFCPYLLAQEVTSHQLASHLSLDCSEGMDSSRGCDCAPQALASLPDPPLAALEQVEVSVQPVGVDMLGLVVQVPPEFITPSLLDLMKVEWQMEKGKPVRRGSYRPDNQNHWHLSLRSYPKRHSERDDSQPWYLKCRINPSQWQQADNVRVAGVRQVEVALGALSELLSQMGLTEEDGFEVKRMTICELHLTRDLMVCGNKSHQAIDEIFEILNWAFPRRSKLGRCDVFHERESDHSPSINSLQRGNNRDCWRVYSKSQERHKKAGEPLCATREQLRIEHKISQSKAMARIFGLALTGGGLLALMEQPKWEGQFDDRLREAFFPSQAVLKPRTVRQGQTHAASVRERRRKCPKRSRNASNIQDSAKGLLVRNHYELASVPAPFLRVLRPYCTNQRQRKYLARLLNNPRARLRLEEVDAFFGLLNTLGALEVRRKVRKAYGLEGGCSKASTRPPRSSKTIQSKPSTANACWKRLSELRAFSTCVNGFLWAKQEERVAALLLSSVLTGRQGIQVQVDN